VRLNSKKVVFECFGEKIERVLIEDIKSIIEENILAGFFFPFCRTGLGLIFLTPPHEKKTFDQLSEILQKQNFLINNNRKYLERALDILLDTGLFSAKWGKIEQNGGLLKWARQFSNRNEIITRLQPYRSHIKAFSLLSSIQLLRWFEMLSQGPSKNPEFFEKILEINAYLAHTGDIIDPDHWHITIKFKSSLYYRDLWRVLYKISKGNIYDSNIKFYHERKKLAIYGLDEWIRKKVKDIQDDYKGVSLEITQCKIRLLLEPEKAPEEIEGEYDFPISKLLVVPIVNFEISGLNGEIENDYPTEIDEIASTLACELTNQFIKRFIEEISKSRNQRLREEKPFDFNVECRLLKFKLEDYKEFENRFVKFLSKYGNLRNDLKMELTHLEYWPLPIREKMEKIEREIEDCVVKNIEENRSQGEVFITVARKGDALIRHLYEIAKNSAQSSIGEVQHKFKRILESFKDGKDREETFYILSDTEFLLKLEKNGYSNLNKIFIFDDAIDRGTTVKRVIEKIKNNLKHSSQNLIIEVLSLVVNKENFDQIKTDFENQGVQLKACQLI